MYMEELFVQESAIATEKAKTGRSGIRDAEDRRWKKH